MAQDRSEDVPATSDAQKKPSTKIIKRYSNRKLYDTERSKYVTLDEIAQMIKAGEEVTIIDNESKEDLTSVTLTQIIFEEEKRESRMPLGMLRNLIQTGGDALQEFFDKSVKAPVVEIKDTAEKRVEDPAQRPAVPSPARSPSPGRPPPPPATARPRTCRPGSPSRLRCAGGRSCEEWSKS
jgi:polyhydroxyalkanoate synthesis repressor PhaR